MGVLFDHATVDGEFPSIVFTKNLPTFNFNNWQLVQTCQALIFQSKYVNIWITLTPNENSVWPLEKIVINLLAFMKKNI